MSKEDFTGTSVALDSQQWSVFDAVMPQPKSRWRCCSTLVHAANRKVEIYFHFAETNSRKPFLVAEAVGGPVALAADLGLSVFLSSFGSS